MVKKNNVVKIDDKIDNEFEDLNKENYRKVTIKELEEKLAGMKKDKETKCKFAKEQLVEMLKVTVDKYRTATGTAEALRVLRFTKGDNDVPILMANTLAYDMAGETDRMRKKAEKLDYAKMDTLCDGFYEKDFDMDEGEEGVSYYYSLAFEMMRIDLCSNVGASAEDMVEFVKRVHEEIDATGKKLKELKAEKED